MIDTEALKRKILDLTISGRLTQHVSEDGTSDELIELIVRRRSELIKQKLIKKYIAEPIAENEKPIDIPDSWRWVRLGTIASVNGGKRIPAGRKLTTENTGYKYIRVSEMKNYSVNTETIMYVPEDIYPKIQNYTISSKDVYITVAGTIGNVGTVPASLDGANLTENANKIVFDIIDQTWLMYTLDSSLIQKVIANSTTQVAQPKLAIKRIQDFVLPFPPVAEQRRIVAIIESAFALVDKIDELQQQYANNITSLNKKILDLAVRGKLVPQDPNDEPASVLLKKIEEEKLKLIKEGKIKKQKALPAITEDEIPFDIPGSWKWVRLEDVTKSITDGDHQAPPQTETGIPFLVISNVSSGFMDFSNTRHVPEEYFEKLSADRKATKGDILFTVTGSYGIPMKVETDQEFCFQRHIALIKPMIDANFLVMLLKSPLVKDQCDRVATGTAQKTVGLGSLRNILVPIPPVNEQIRILETLKRTIPIAENLN